MAKSLRLGFAAHAGRSNVKAVQRNSLLKNGIAVQRHSQQWGGRKGHSLPSSSSAWAFLSILPRNAIRGSKKQKLKCKKLFAFLVPPYGEIAKRSRKL